MILILVERFTFFLTNLVLPNSFGLKDFIVNNRLTSERKLRVLGNGSSNGIDLSFFNTSEKIKMEAELLKERLDLNNKLVFLFIGRIVSHKGIEELVDSFISLNDRFPQTRLLLVGNFENELDPVSPVTIKQLGHPAIKHVGYQSDVRSFLELSDIFVFPSYREGFPNAVLQACAFNLPCIVSDINGCNEIIKNRINGLLVPCRAKKELYEAMELLASDSFLRNELGKYT
jgi:glycosyltransferase involved in cell wall biosynthesis